MSEQTGVLRDINLQHRIRR